MLNFISKLIEFMEVLVEFGFDWLVVKKFWGLVWELYWIGFGSLFGLLVIYFFFVLVLVK